MRTPGIMSPEFVSRLCAAKVRFVAWDLDRWARLAKIRARVSGCYNGIPAQTGHVLEACKWFLTSWDALAIVTRDEGAHTGGWWKNPDYERCLHLSLSFWDAETGLARGLDRKGTAAIVGAVFGKDCRLLWTESPKSDVGIRSGVWHYRLFMNGSWTEPKLPRKEVYTRDFIPSGWKSWSDVQADLAVPDFGQHTTSISCEGHIEVSAE